MRLLPHLLKQLNAALRERRISEGIALLENSEKAWSKLRASDPVATDFVLCVAQWIDVGYKSPVPMEDLLARFSSDLRSQMPMRHFLFLRMAEAFSALSREDADTAIELLEFVLKAERELADDWLIALAHFWKGRAHRKKGEYEIALQDIIVARSHAEAMKAGKLAAVIQVQEAWLLFQKGEPKTALALLNRAEHPLAGTNTPSQAQTMRFHWAISHRREAASCAERESTPKRSDITNRQFPSTRGAMETIEI